MFKIVGSHENQQHNSVLHKLIKQFMPFSQEKLGWDQPVTINLLSDPENAQDPLGKTAHYEPNSKKVTLFVVGRHPKDILRSLSHELVHHKQNCQGLFTGDMDTSHGYAQNNDHLRNMEKEAYEKGNICFRDWEDGIKSSGKNITMSENNKYIINEGLIDQFVRWLERKMAQRDYEKKTSPEHKAAEEEIKRIQDAITAQAKKEHPEWFRSEREKLKENKQMHFNNVVDKIMNLLNEQDNPEEASEEGDKEEDTEKKEYSKGDSKRDPKVGKQLMARMKAAAKNNPKAKGDWRKLPTDDPSRVAYRNWYTGKEQGAGGSAVAAPVSSNNPRVRAYTNQIRTLQGYQKRIAAAIKKRQAAIKQLGENKMEDEDILFEYLGAGLHSEEFYESLGEVLGVVTPQKKPGERHGVTTDKPDCEGAYYHEMHGWLCPGEKVGDEHRGKSPNPQRMEEEIGEKTNESKDLWIRGNKDQMLFEELVNKWTKER